MKNRFPAAQRGFNLVELLIAVAVLSLGLLALARFQGQLIEGSALAKERTVALKLAQEKLEQFANTRQDQQNDRRKTDP